MGECQKGCQKQISFSQMRKDLESAERGGLLRDMPLELLAAVGIKESYGNQWFSKNDLQYKENMVVAMRATKLSEAAILGKITRWRKNPVMQIPKFRFEKSWSDEARTLMHKVDAEQDWQMILQMSFGYFQKGMVWHLSAKPYSTWSQAMSVFLNSPDEQIRVCVNDLQGLIKNAHGDLGLALTRYNAGGSASHRSKYGDDVLNLYHALLKEKPKGGL
jgi:hypothetical protein